MRVLVTGASGFIGANLLKSLSKNNEILAVSRNNQINSNNINWVKSDLSNFNNINEIVKNFEPESCIHLAWQGIPDFNLENSKKNLNNSVNLISALSNCKKLKKILVSGSCLEYKLQTKECIETMRVEPYDYFTWSKKSIYDFLKFKSLEKDINYYWYRIFYSYGPMQRSESVIPVIIKNLLNKKLPNINNPNNLNDFIYIDDVIRVFYKTLSNNINSGIYNLGNGSNVSILFILKYLENAILESDNFYNLYKNKINKTKLSRIANNKKIIDTFNIDKFTDIKKGLSKTLKFYLKNNKV